MSPTDPRVPSGPADVTTIDPATQRPSPKTNEQPPSSNNPLGSLIPSGPADVTRIDPRTQQRMPDLPVPVDSGCEGPNSDDSEYDHTDDEDADGSETTQQTQISRESSPSLGPIIPLGPADVTLIDPDTQQRMPDVFRVESTYEESDDEDADDKGSDDEHSGEPGDESDDFVKAALKDAQLAGITTKQ